MPVFLLDSDLFFPDPEEASSEGLLAVGGDLSEDRLLLAYESGIFPWYSQDDPVLWWSPDPRCVLKIENLKISKSMRNIINRGIFRCTFDNEFSTVMDRCGSVRAEGEGTWITGEMLEAYNKLHDLGIAHSVEVWHNDKLVGGLYGLSLGNMFFGESMFSQMSNSSKYALICLCNALKSKGFEYIDCQIYNSHLGSLGAENMKRKDFLKLLKESMKHETLRGSWEDLK